MLIKSLFATLLLAAFSCSLFAQGSQKAYNTLNFGDSYDVARDKLAKLLHGPTAIADNFDDPIADADLSRWWVGYPQYLWDNNKNYGTPNNALQTYFGRGKRVEIESVDGFNDTQEIECGIFNAKGDAAHSGLAIVVVNYQDVPQDALTAKFMATYPQAKKTTQSFASPSDKHPGIVMQYDREVLEYTSGGVEIALSLPTRKFILVFKDLSQMNEKELQVWDQLSKQANASRETYYSDVKASIMTAQQVIMTASAVKITRHPMDALTYLGWYSGYGNERVIFGPPILIVRNDTLIEYHLSRYDRSIQEAQDAQAQAKKSEVDKALGF